MKKGILVLLTLGLLIITTSFTGQKNTVDESFNLKFTSAELQTLWYALEKSNAEYTVVVTLKSNIERQIQEQVRVKQELKAKEDSSKKEPTEKKKKN